MGEQYYVVDSEKKEALVFWSERPWLDEVQFEHAIANGITEPWLREALGLNESPDEQLANLLKWIEGRDRRQISVLRGEEVEHELFMLGVKFVAGMWGQEWLDQKNQEGEYIRANLDPNAPPAVLPKPKLMPLLPRIESATEKGPKKISRSFSGVPHPSAAAKRREVCAPEEHLEEDDMQYIRKLAFELAGEASMAWDETPKGIFRTDLAQRAVDGFMKRVRFYLDRAYVRGQTSMMPLIWEEETKQQPPAT